MSISGMWASQPASNERLATELVDLRFSYLGQHLLMTQLGQTFNVYPTWCVLQDPVNPHCCLLCNGSLQNLSVSFVKPMIRNQGRSGHYLFTSPSKPSYPYETHQVGMCLAGTSIWHMGVACTHCHGQLHQSSLYVAGIVVNELWQARSLGWWVWILALPVHPAG